jgi:hypothetical protein
MDTRVIFSFDSETRRIVIAALGRERADDAGRRRPPPYPRWRSIGEAALPGTNRRNSEAGITTLEAAIAMMVLAIALLALWGTIIYCSRSNLAAEQKKQALHAAQAKVEELKSRPFDTLIAEYGPGGTVGNTFAVTALDDSEQVAQGQIAFFVDETDSLGDGSLGLPLDLNGDGDAEDVDVSAGYNLLPVQVTIRWEGALGEQSVNLRSILRKED